jgi:DNA-binding CsgD family transcriptional regulator
MKPDPNLNGFLTNREREVAVLVSGGYTNRQVGVRLGITEVTVRHHLSSIFSKLGIANRFELIGWVYRRGLSIPAGMAGFVPLLHTTYQLILDYVLNAMGSCIV